MLRFRRGVPPNEDGLHGHVLARISGGAFSVGNLTKGTAVWNQRYYAFGGSEGDVFQLFASKQAYHECVMGAYENRRVNQRIETFNLSKDHKCSKIKNKMYRSHGSLYYFALKVPSLRFTAAKFASRSEPELVALHRKLCLTLDRKRSRS